MTVKCINAEDQAQMVLNYSSGLCSIEDLMLLSGKSRRTIQRMLEDAGFDPIVHRRHRRTKAEMLLAAKQIDMQFSTTGRVNHLRIMDLVDTKIPFQHVILTKTPWYRKILQTVIRPFV